MDSRDDTLAEVRRLRPLLAQDYAAAERLGSVERERILAELVELERVLDGVVADEDCF